MFRSILGAIMCAFLLTACSPHGTDAQRCCAGSASCGFAGVTTPDNTLSPEEQSAGWKLLFDGKSFDGWGCTASDFPGWSIKDGVINLDRRAGGYLYTNGRFTNFELKIDFMVDRRTNSGLFFRWADLGDPVQTGFEMQIYDSAGRNPAGRHDCGALYDILAPSSNPMKPAMEWNSVVLKCRNQYITITMNDVRIIQANLDKYTQEHRNIDGSDNKFGTALKDFSRTGHIGLQAHGGAAWFKNIKIREISQ